MFDRSHGIIVSFDMKKLKTNQETGVIWIGNRMMKLKTKAFYKAEKLPSRRVRRMMTAYQYYLETGAIWVRTMTAFEAFMSALPEDVPIRFQSLSNDMVFGFFQGRLLIVKDLQNTLRKYYEGGQNDHGEWNVIIRREEMISCTKETAEIIQNHQLDRNPATWTEAERLMFRMAL